MSVTQPLSLHISNPTLLAPSPQPLSTEDGVDLLDEVSVLDNVKSHSSLAPPSQPPSNQGWMQDFGRGDNYRIIIVYRVQTH
jgi:hypothetical protein